MTEEVVVEWHTRSGSINVSGGLNGKESTCNVGDPGSISWEDPLEKRNGNSFQYPCLENSMEKGDGSLESMG